MNLGQKFFIYQKGESYKNKRPINFDVLGMNNYRKTEC